MTLRSEWPKQHHRFSLIAAQIVLVAHMMVITIATGPANCSSVEMPNI